MIFSVDPEQLLWTFTLYFIVFYNSQRFCGMSREKTTKREGPLYSVAAPHPSPEGETAASGALGQWPLRLLLQKPEIIVLLGGEEWLWGRQTNKTQFILSLGLAAKPCVSQGRLCPLKCIRTIKLCVLNSTHVLFKSSYDQLGVEPVRGWRPHHSSIGNSIPQATVVCYRQWSFRSPR